VFYFNAFLCWEISVSVSIARKATTFKLHPVTNRPLKDGDFVWEIEVCTYPADYSAERHDAGDYDVSEEVDISYAWAASQGVARSFAKMTEKKLGFDRKPGALQWGIRYRRLWWNGKRWELDLAPDWIGG
jgi:hypothetical protein